AEDGIRGFHVTGVQTCALPISSLIVTIGTQYVIRSFLLTFVGTALFMNIPSAMDAFGKASLFTHHAANGVVSVLPATVLVLAVRSEERRVGKECRCRCRQRQ